MAARAESMEPRQLLSNTYYVSNAGSNGSGTTGTSPQTPFPTLAYALTKIVAGDTIKVHAGTYREKVTLPYFTSTANTTITTDGSGPVVISGADPFAGTWTAYSAVIPTAGGSVYAAAYAGTSPHEVINSGRWLQEIGYESAVHADTAGGESGRPERNAVGSNSVVSMVPNSFYFVPTPGASAAACLRAV